MAVTLKSSLNNQVRSEKLAALGGLVAGVAHEINTPLGVCITAISMLKEESEKIQVSLATGCLEREELDSFIGDTANVGKIVEKNLYQAANLVKSFKQVSADQSSDIKRIILLDEYIDEVIASLTPELKRSGIKVARHCQSGVRLELNPGLVSQIITILVMNAKMHAFGQGQAGLISVEAYLQSGNLVIVLTDDGQGMANEELSRIFDPFFTTKRGSGGTGLGLYILHTIIKERFAGSVSAESVLNEGTKFTINLPIRDESLKVISV